MAGEAVPAFKDPLVPHEEHGGRAREGKLKQFLGNPDYVVREVSFDYAQEMNGDRLPFKDIQKIAVTARRCFKELRKQFGISNSAMFVVAENDNGEEVLYAITRNVSTRDFSSLSQFGKERVARRYRTLLEKILDYFEHKLRTGRWFLGDLHLDNFAFGKQKGDFINRIRFIDADPRLGRGKKAIRAALISFEGDCLSVAESRYGEYADFRAIRTRWNKLFAKAWPKSGYARDA